MPEFRVGRSTRPSLLFTAQVSRKWNAKVLPRNVYTQWRLNAELSEKSREKRTKSTGVIVTVGRLFRENP